MTLGTKHRNSCLTWWVFLIDGHIAYELCQCYHLSFYFLFCRFQIHYKMIQIFLWNNIQIWHNQISINSFSAFILLEIDLPLRGKWKWSLSVVSKSFVTPWTVVAYQVPASTGFSKLEHCSGLPFPSPGDLPGLGIEPRSPALQADYLTTDPLGKLP